MQSLAIFRSVFDLQFTCVHIVIELSKLVASFWHFSRFICFSVLSKYIFCSVQESKIYCLSREQISAGRNTLFFVVFFKMKYVKEKMLIGYPIPITQLRFQSKNS